MKVSFQEQNLIQSYGTNMNKLIVTFIILIIYNGCNSDYDKNMGDNYRLIKTNACCIYIFNEEIQATKIGNITYYDNRIIKPMIKKIWYNNEIIIGYKEKNECCFLDDYEKENPNGYFIINKKNQEIIDGLDRKTFLDTLKKYHIKINDITFESLI